MQQITFHNPKTVDDACTLLAEHTGNAIVLAGGQSLVQMLKQRVVGADHVVSIGHLDELHGVHLDCGALRIGATTTYETVRRHALVRESLPVLPEMISTVADRQIRSRGTLVGGIAHADPAGDPPVLAVAFDADVRLRSTTGERTVSGSEFYEGLYETARRADELVTEVGFPVADDVTACYRSFTPRQGDYAVASIAAVIRRSTDGRIDDATIVAGSVTDAPIRLREAEAVLSDAQPNEGVIEEASEAGRDAANPDGDAEWSSEYKRTLVGVLIVDALEALLSDSAEDQHG